MSAPQISLSWSDYQKYFCTGLSGLQQNGELVDMTLAADGHFVKVHQLVIALASPYFKDLISSANCQHPVIFLSKISYTTLSAILEYIYTGEVVVPLEGLKTLLEAAKELHIKGLEEMDPQSQIKTLVDPRHGVTTDTDEHYSYDQEEQAEDNEKYYLQTNSSVDDETKYLISQDENVLYDETITEHEEEIENSPSITEPVASTSKLKAKEAKSSSGTMQYTISNQGSLQMILNRYMYFLKHCTRDNRRHWRCVDYLKADVKCPAYVVSKDDLILKRIAQHKHTFHDNKILKKLKQSVIFSAFHEAQFEGSNKKKEKCSTDSGANAITNDASLEKLAQTSDVTDNF